MKRVVRSLAVIVGLALCSPQLLAAEKWADPRLPVSDGLEVWLDATTLSSASEANGASPPRAGGAVATWYDGSGKKRDARQDAPGRRPVFVPDRANPKAPVVQFDGRDDAILADVDGIDLRDFTLFLVAAPYSNQGLFRAMLAVNERNQNDYTTGINVDLGPGGSGAFESVNVEGRGFSGVRDLMNDGASFALGTFHTIALGSSAGGNVALHLDGARHAQRPRTGDPIRPHELRVGARWANPGPNNPGETGYFDGAIAEVLFYSRKLSDDERAKVEQYLRAKHAPLFDIKGLPPRPPVQMLVPGFTVHELPVKLPNLTAIRYGPDGRLYGAGYDGRMHVLTDTDGDGIEDKSDVLWDKAPFRTPMAFNWAPDGTMYVTSNGKISALRDTDGDGKMDLEQVVNTGWPPDAGFTGGGVDAMGLVFDKEGNFYFGLGCSLFANPYMVDEKTDKPRYDLGSERGTILKVSADGKKREIVCTGIRFPVGLAMNRAGDLFCTDQEGDTWLKGGNPVDELNHIIPGKHYGFPHRHEKYLPDVVDEPPAVVFGPQHQSTCGLIFNEPTDRQTATWGPKWWEGNAIVCGYSRGKIWRVPLAKTEHGYLGRPLLLAALRLLTLEPAIDPRGNLIVVTHSGEPDWGTGPGGPGRIFKLVYSDPDAPQPVLAWAENATEVRVAFDRPVGSNLLGDLTKVSIAYGEFVRAGDRFEVLKPPYEVVAQQARAYRGELRVTAAKLSDDRRTLVLTTDPHPMQAWYAVSVPLAGGPLPDGQERVIEVDYDLTGVEATYSSRGERSISWSGWLPHLSPDVSRAITRGSAQHEKFFALIDKVGGNVTLAPFRDETSPHVAYRSQRTVTRYPQWVPRELPVPPPPKDVSIDHLAGGDWKRGQALFFGAEANCHTCHVIRGQGGHVGPDLSNLPHRDLASLYRDITEPNAVINPDHRGYTALLTDGRVLAGLVRSDSADKLRIYDTAGKETVVPRSQVKHLRADAISIMPEGYAKLGEQKVKDLLAFLTMAAPPRPSAPQARRLNQGGAAPVRPLKEGRVAESGGNRPPPRRARAEVDAVLAKSEKPDASNLRPLRVCLVAGPKDHGPGEHDYPQWQKDWAPLMKKLPQVEVSTAFGPPDAKLWESADLMVFYCWGPQFWSDKTGIYPHLDKFLARGGGVVLLHSATIAEKDPKEMAQHLGLCYAPMIKFRHGPLDLNVPAAVKDHPVMRGFGVVHQVDESYWPHAEAGEVTTLATTPEEGSERPMAWASQRSRGRVFGTLLGHYTWTFDDPLARALILRGMAWAAGEPSGRFDALVMDGIEITDK